ncbi:helix-turn-helix domain-containing protein [Fibrobacterota bacterium]
MKKNKKDWPTITEAVKKSLQANKNIIDNKETMREFNKLQFEKPKNYKPEDIVILRKRKMKMSQSVFAYVCNIKLPTLQKWERGVSKPTAPIRRLFQLIEKDALTLIKTTES